MYERFNFNERSSLTKLIGIKIVFDIMFSELFLKKN